MNKSRKLTLIGTALFLLSFLLRSYRDGNGFDCAWFCLSNGESIIMNGFDWGSAFYFAFSFPNLLMLTLPFLVFVHYRDRSLPRKLIGLQVLCLLYALSWWVINLGSLPDVRIGYYVWIGSMAFLLWATCSTRRKPDLAQENPEASQAPA
jgi:hypothetical protein